MQSFTRRRFLAISACALALGTQVSAMPQITQWHATALGAHTTLSLAHPDAKAIAGEVFAELRRLEGIFSLYQPDSAISRLNRDGRLLAPPFELLECLGLCHRMHKVSGGLFDPTVQPLWTAYANPAAQDEGNPNQVERAQALLGWSRVAFDSQRIGFAQSGMAITLNGIAQGYIADRIARLLSHRGLSDLMIDTGELRALGGHPQGGGWPVTLETVDNKPVDTITLRDTAMATSAPAGTQFASGRQAGHILDPLTGRPSLAPWRLVSVTGPSAAIADGLSTAICLMTDQQAINAALSAFSGTRLVHLS